MINLIALLVAIAGILAVAGNAGYLALLNEAAKKRGLAGDATRAYVKDQWKPVAIAGGVAAFALLLTSGGVALDILAILVGAGAGAMAIGHLGKVRQKYGNNPELT